MNYLVSVSMVKNPLIDRYLTVCCVMLHIASSTLKISAFVSLMLLSDPKAFNPRS